MLILSLEWRGARDNRKTRAAAGADVPSPLEKSLPFYVFTGVGGFRAVNAPYAIRDTSSIYSPALLFYKELIVRNIEQAIRMAGKTAELYERLI